MGFKVGVLDADVYGPSMPIMFDVEEESPLSITVDGRSKMKPVENYGVKLSVIRVLHAAESSCYLARTNGFKSIKSNDLRCRLG